MNYLRSNIQISQLVMDKIKLIPLKILRSHKTLFVKVTYFNLKSSFKEKTKTIASELKQHIALTNRAITKIQKDSNVIVNEVKQIHDSFFHLYPIVKKQMDELISDLKGVVGKHVLIDELEAKDGYLSTFVIEEQQHYDEIVGVLSIPSGCYGASRASQATGGTGRTGGTLKPVKKPRDPSTSKEGCSYKKSHHSVR
ncbi:hypothetical protein BASA61_008634 [Batrachochytrium salamandrivorans]|nr:hypothetical protein BASA61_008634 [Batrachochytrium salamandrivorans]